MNKSSSASFANSAQNTFNLLEEWQKSKSAEENYYRQAGDVISRGLYEKQKIRRENDEKIGGNIAKAGASGIKVSSFDDAFLSDELEVARELYDKDRQVEEQASALRRQARNERGGRIGKVLSYSVGLLSNFSG